MTRAAAKNLVDRLTRPQRIGIFGHRGVGKTTLVTMLYREAAGGRLAGLRLAAANAATARHLGDKIAQLESGQPLPATLAETELRFHLYHQGSRTELVILDYQGEHVALGRNEPIRDFFRDCDAVLLCLDAPLSASDNGRWLAEQEVEQVVEDYLATERAGEPHRPMALLVTKADLLANAEQTSRLELTQHALHTHCPWHQTFRVSCLGSQGELKPVGLDVPLVWLATALLEQDTARLERLWQVAPNSLDLLGRATTVFARRHPEADVTKTFAARLARTRASRRLRHFAMCALSLLLISLGVLAYDAFGAARFAAVARDDADKPEVVRQALLDYQTWHPTRHLTLTGNHREREYLVDLDRRIRDDQRDQRYAELRRRGDDPDVDPEALWADFIQFRDEFAEYDLDEEGAYLRLRIKDANDRRRDRKAHLALRDLEQAERTKELPQLAELAGSLAREYAGSVSEPEFLRRQAAYLHRIDERDFETARDYSTRNPLNFFTRKEKYQLYLDRHPSGANASQARQRITEVSQEWDRHDYRAVRDLYTESPGEIKEVRTRCRTYLSAHADGKFREVISELLKWCDQVSEARDYTVTLKSGSFSKKIAHTMSWGPTLSVAIEVNGVRHGPSTIAKRGYEPEWDYEFARPVRWKAGDSVRIIVTDNYYWNRQMVDETFDDVLAMRHLSGEVEVKYGTLTFSSDFRMPTLPAE